jgi:hypothetical protein
MSAIACGRTVVEYVSMVETDEQRQKECLGKLTWKTLELARAASAYAVWQYGGRKALPYQCRWCKNWHLKRGFD